MSRKKSEKGRRRRRILSIIISFFISLSVTLILASILLKGGLFNQQLFKQTLAESEFYDSKLEDIKSNINDILASAGFPTEISEDVITRTLITMEVNKVMRGEESDSTDFSEVMNERIMEHFSENNIPISESMTQAIDVMVSDMVKVYETHMTMLFAKMYNEFCNKYVGIINIVLYVSIALLIICAVLLMILNTRVYRGMRYVGYGILAGSVMTEVISLLAKKSLVNMVEGNNTEYYKVIIEFINKGFSQGIYMCLGGVMVFCMVLLLTSYLKKQVI